MYRQKNEDKPGYVKEYPDKEEKGWKFEQDIWGEIIDVDIKTNKTSSRIYDPATGKAKPKPKHEQKQEEEKK